MVAILGRDAGKFSLFNLLVERISKYNKISSHCLMKQHNDMCILKKEFFN